MDFQEALEYLQGRLRLGMKFGNERFLALLERLGNPQNSLQVVHIAGTKGKGSTATMTASILIAAAYRTGIYLSPYVYDIRERIQIDGVQISRDDFARWIARIKPHVEALEKTDFGATTEFELKTAVGLCYFAEQQVDYCVVEVGLGGRLDATNVFPSPLVTVITTIGYDHVELLGPTLTDIAREKAGIVKEGVPCVTAVEPGTEAYGTIAKICAEKNVSLAQVRWCASSSRETDQDRMLIQGYEHGTHLTGHPSPKRGTSDFGRGAGGEGIDFWASDDGSLTIHTPVRSLDGIRLRLRGSFQHANAATALGALDSIPFDRRPAISDAAARLGLERAYLPGRCERISDRPTVILDGAHNELAAQALANALVESDLLSDTRRLLLVVGLSRNHAPGPFLEPLLTLNPAAVIATQPAFHPRDANEVSSVANAANMKCVKTIVSSVADACREALSMANPDDVICLTGSFYTLGDVPPDLWRKLLEERNFIYAAG